MAQNIAFNKNEDELKMMVSEMKSKLDKIHKGGGPKKIEKHKAKGKMTARERIAFLLDKGRPQIEIGAFAGYDMYKEHGGCPGGGVVVVIGYLKSKMVMVIANDATVKAGAWFPITGKKNLRAQKLLKKQDLIVKNLVNLLKIQRKYMG